MILIDGAGVGNLYSRIKHRRWDGRRWYHPHMVQDAASAHLLPSPFDPYIIDALRFVERQGDIPIAELAARCAAEFQWLPGFADVVVAFLRTNRLITLDPWEPGSLQVAPRGQRWLAEVAADPAFTE